MGQAQYCLRSDDGCAHQLYYLDGWRKPANGVSMALSSAFENWCLGPSFMLFAFRWQLFPSALTSLRLKEAGHPCIQGTILNLWNLVSHGSCILSVFGCFYYRVRIGKYIVELLALETLCPSTTAPDASGEAVSWLKRFTCSSRTKMMEWINNQSRSLHMLMKGPAH